MKGITRCKIGMKEANYIESIIEDIEGVELLYQGSIHGFDYKNFRSRCYSKSPTITLF